MNIPLALAASLSVLTLFAHIFGGGPEIHEPILQSELSDYFKAILSVIWHAVSVILFLNSGALGWAALKPEQRTAIVALVSAQYTAWGLLFVYYGLTRLGSLWPMPQWIAFFLIPALALLGLWQSQKNLSRQTAFGLGSDHKPASPRTKG